MAFQESISTSEDSSAYAHYLLSFSSVVDNPRLCINNQAAQQPPLRTPPRRSDILLAGEIVPCPISERCLPAPACDFRGASLRGDVGSSVIRCLTSSSDYDSSHPSLDAHSRSPPLRPDFVKIDSFIPGPGVCKVQLRTCEILSRLQASAGTINPVILENHYANSTITKVSINGLHQNSTHINILGMEFTSQLSASLQQMLTQVKSIKILIQEPSESQAQFIGAIDCTWNPTSRRLMAVVTKFLSHVKIFYQKYPCVEFYVELCNVKVIPSTPSCDIPHPAFGVKPPQPFMLYDDYQTLPNINVTRMNDESDSPEVAGALDDRITSDSIVQITNVACEGGNLRIRLNSSLLYSIIKEGSIGKPYPEAFKTTVLFNDCEFIVLFKVFPFTSRSEHISVWAEVTAPLQANGQVTVKVTASDPQKDERLGHTVTCIEKLKHSDVGNCKEAKCTLGEVMLHMFAFYRSPDVMVNVSISFLEL